MQNYDLITNYYPMAEYFGLSTQEALKKKAIPKKRSQL